MSPTDNDATKAAEGPAQIEALYCSVKSGQPVRFIDTVMVVASAGLQGCRHSRAGSERSLVMVDVETLEDLQLVPGTIKENVTTRGIALQRLPRGTRLRLGESAIVEITGPCEPCRAMDRIRAGLRRELDGRRGVTARAIASGSLRIGDAIVVF